MKQFLLFSLFLGICFSAYSQNYQTVNSSEVKLFEGKFGNIRGYSIDSVAIIGGDSLMYPSRNIQRVGEDWDDCYDVESYSMLGEYVRIMADGTNLFFNFYGDTIRLNTSAPAGHTWMMWKGEDFDVYGEMSETTISEVFGIADSVKSVKLKAYDAEMNLVENFPYNDSLISISKNFGLLTTFNFVAFPSYSEHYYQEYAQLYSLYSIENQNLGGDNLTTFDVYDFQPGDIIEYENAQLFFGSGTKRQFREEYTSRVNYPDSIVYGLNLKVLTFQYSIEEEDPEISVATYQISRTIKPIDFLDALPGVALPKNEMSEYYSVIMLTDTYVQKQNLEYAVTGNTVYQGDDPDCYMRFIDNTCGGQPDSYYKGLGGPYYECEFFGSPNYNKLTYFYKDSIAWGAEFDFTVSVPEAATQEIFSIFPNPAKDKFKIRMLNAPHPGRLEIVDVSGRIVLSKTLTFEESEIDIANLTSGIYFVRFPLSGNKTVQKLIVE